jgi:hypothetical protein
MPQNHYQSTVELLGGEFDAVTLRGRYNVSGDTDHKKITGPLVEYNLGRHPRV